MFLENSYKILFESLVKLMTRKVSNHKIGKPLQSKIKKNIVDLNKGGSFGKKIENIIKAQKRKINKFK